MARKYGQKRPLLGWCSGRKDCYEDRFIQIGVSLIEHPAVIRLKASEFKLYLLMIKAAGQSREFILPRSEYTPYFTPATFSRCKKTVLLNRVLFEVVYSGKSTREPSSTGLLSDGKIQRYNHRHGYIIEMCSILNSEFLGYYKKRRKTKGSVFFNHSKIEQCE